MLAQQRMLERRLGATADEIPILRTRLLQLRESTSAQKITVDGASESIASANLQSELEELAASAAVAISSIEGVPAEARGAYRRIGLRIAITGPYESIVKLLAAIETASPPLVVENLQIHGVPQVQSLLQTQTTVRRQVSSDTDQRLDTRLDVYGFRSNETPAIPK